jgi:geranylgeranyl reductase family protein
MSDEKTLSRPTFDDHLYDVVIVGAGPSGSASAYWLAASGWDVLLIEKKQFPREKTCGDGLTPRTVKQLADMGVEEKLGGAHRYRGLRSMGFGHSMEMRWPEHPIFPDYGYTISRHDLDGLIAHHAQSAGATLWQKTEVLAPVIEDHSAPLGAGNLPSVAGLTVRFNGEEETHVVRGRYYLIADGSNSRIGRALGTARDKDYPLGMALRGYYSSPLHADDFIESHLDIRDDHGEVVPGYGWIFPMGDGRVNVGVGLLSTDQRWKGVNTTTLMEAFVKQAPAHWELRPENALNKPTGGKLPMGLAVGPHFGDNVLIVGDAAGSVNPFNGEGIAYGYETGRLAAAHVGRAASGEGRDAIADYARELELAYGRYYKVGRAFVRLISSPEVMAACVSLGMRSRPIMEALLRIMANLQRPDAPGGAETAYVALEELASRMPAGAVSSLLSKVTSGLAA